MCLTICVHFSGSPSKEPFSEFLFQIWLVKVPGGNSRDLGCHVTGRPRPVITWQYDGQPLGRSSLNTTYRDKDELHHAQVYDLQVPFPTSQVSTPVRSFFKDAKLKSKQFSIVFTKTEIFKV